MNSLVSTDTFAVATTTPPVSDVLAAGTRVGPWCVEHELGRGGMGAVYAVVHDGIGKRAALKVIHQHELKTSSVERMLIEARVVNRVEHAGIVDIFDTGLLPDGRPYIVMERLEGQSLAQRARAGKLLPDTVVEILEQVCDALIAAHSAGVIHRDLKTDNIFLVDNESGAVRVKLLDWGIAKETSALSRKTTEGLVVGTPHYLSPEQARGTAVTEKTDVYSLGVMAFELFLEQLPFDAETSVEVMALHLRAAPPFPHDIWPEIPLVLESLLLAMLTKNADQRPAMSEVAKSLEHVRAEIVRRKLRTPIRAHVSNRIALAHTVTASSWRAPRRTWRYVAGGTVLAAFAAMLTLLSGSGGVATAMTTVHVERPAVVVARPLLAAPSPPKLDAPVSPPELDAPVRAAHKRVRVHVAPRLIAQPVAKHLDPDGTIDAYR
jgi:eukaryotic-like serine/threonine-protein kinase